jgi:uncharacterized membrane protein
MLQIPPLPTWDSLHPLIIHFPVVLLLLSPLFILISLVLAPPKGKPYMIAALLVLILGTGSLFIAGSTGHAASELAERGGAVDKVLEMHEDLASKTQIVFAGLSVILLGMFLAPRILHRQEDRLLSSLLPAAFLALYSVGVLFLVNTAHAGGRLVHEFGIHAIVPATSEQSLPAHETESPVEETNNRR